ncbi:DUF4167 domain-containing protein [Boseaceae bacterium BT-24-1]|nr:DUF4167 domain-containing protein [Boseaceae bacterium BT-24-1]
MTTRPSRTAAFDNRFTRPGPRTDAAQTKQGSTPRASYERYLALAKAKALAGDRVEAERYYQYAEHYHRLMHGTAA